MAKTTIIGLFREDWADLVIKKITNPSVTSYYSVCDSISQDYRFLRSDKEGLHTVGQFRGLRKGRLPRNLRNAIQSLLLGNVLEVFFLIACLRRLKGTRPTLVSTFPILAAIGIMFRNLGLIGKVVYWSIDWYSSSLRVYEGSIPRAVVGTLAQLSDRFCFVHSDLVWDLAIGISRARYQRWGQSLIAKRHNVMYPLARFAPTAGKAPRLPHRLIFIGRDYYFTEGGELWIIAQVVKSLRDHGMSVILEILTGALEFTQRQLAFLAYVESIGIKKFVVMHRYVDYLQASRIVSEGFCGLAIFSDDRISNFAFPGKIMNYFENGIPVVITRHSALSSLVERENAGVVVRSLDKYELEKAVCRILDRWGDYQEGVSRIVDTYMNGNALLSSLRSLELE